MSIKVYPEKSTPSWLTLSKFVGRRRFDVLNVLKTQKYIVDQEDSIVKIDPAETVLISTHQLLESDEAVPVTLRFRENPNRLQATRSFTLKPRATVRPVLELHNPNDYAVLLDVKENFVQLETKDDVKLECAGPALTLFQQTWTPETMLEHFDQHVQEILVAERIEKQLLRATLFEQMRMNPWELPTPEDWKPLHIPEPTRDKDGVPELQ